MQVGARIYHQTDAILMTTYAARPAPGTLPVLTVAGMATGSPGVLKWIRVYATEKTSGVGAA